MAFIIWQGKSEHSDWFFLGKDFAIRTISKKWKQSSTVYFLFSKAGKFKTSMARAVLGNIGPRSFCTDLGPIFPSTALTIS